MALIKCSNCGAKISDKATSCPKCGNPQFVVCAECQNEVSIYHNGSCPECGNPDVQDQIEDYLAALEQSENEEREEQDDVESNRLVMDKEIKLRLFVGLYFSLLVSYWATEGLNRHTLLEFFPISIVLFVSGVLFPRIFGIFTFIGVLLYLYQMILQHYFSV